MLFAQGHDTFEPSAKRQKVVASKSVRTVNV